MSEWRDIKTAPKDGTPFLAWNTDGEVHVARFDELGRINRRSHQQEFPQQFEIRGEERVLVKETFHFRTSWSVWTNGYDFDPIYWMPVEPPDDSAVE